MTSAPTARPLIRSTCLASLVATCLAGASHALPQTVEAHESLRGARELVLRAADSVASISVGVQRGDELLWQESFGLADVANGIPATPATAYPLASLTKSMTATLGVILAARGRVELDAPVLDVLGADALRVYEGDASKLTLRNVLAMRAGVPHGWRSYAYDVEDAPRLADCLRRTSVVTFAPGGEFLYSNLTYGIAEAVFERATKRSFDELMRTELFAPLGMDTARVGRPEFPAAVQHRAGGGTIGGRFMPAAAAGAYASVVDLLRYARFHMGELEGTEALLDGDSLALLHPKPGADEGYFGFGQVDLGDGLMWTLTNGSFTGCTSMLTIVPSQSLAVVVLVNTGSSPSLADELALDITDALVVGFAARARETMALWDTYGATTPFEPRAEWLGDWTGRIAADERDVPFTLSFDPDGGIWATWDDAGDGALGGARLRDDRLIVSLRAPIPFDESGGEMLDLDFELVLEPARIHGAVTANYANERGSFRLSHYVELERDGKGE